MLRPLDDARDGQLLLAWLEDHETARWLAAPDDRPPTPRANAGTTRWIFERDGASVGYGELLDAEDGSYTRVMRVVVDPGRRRQGLGAELVRSLVEQARTRRPGIPIYARIDPGNLPALLAYPSAGLVPLEPLPAGFDERWVWLATLDNEPDVPGGPIED
jgi:GNAT superfamily N-acetyltransferase